MRVKCRVRVRDKIGCRVRVMVRVMVRVSVMSRVRFQEAPGTDPTAEQLYPQTVYWRTLGRVPVRISLWFPRPVKVWATLR